MRENIANPTSMESFSFNGLQNRPLPNISKEQEPMAISISSNVYYGYQPIRIQNNAETTETMDIDLNKSCIRMDTLPHPVNRKRTRDPPTEPRQGLWKKSRHNEPVNVPIHTTKCLPISQLDEDLLRETHGCSYYHWVSSNM